MKTLGFTFTGNAKDTFPLSIFNEIERKVGLGVWSVSVFPINDMGSSEISSSSESSKQENRGIAVLNHTHTHTNGSPSLNIDLHSLNLSSLVTAGRNISTLL